MLKTEGTVAEVLAMYDASTSQIFGSNNTYANSSLDTYCSTTFYNSLSSTMQNAIIAKTFQQDSWVWSGGSSAIANYEGTYGASSNYTLSLMSTTYGSSINRKCYVLSCQDVIDYLDVKATMTADDTTLTSENVWKMFWKQAIAPSGESCWLRSACNSPAGSAIDVSAGRGCMGYSSATVDFAVRPAFQIDLSKISWS